jgi:hypothetical protein
MAKKNHKCFSKCVLELNFAPKFKSLLLHFSKKVKIDVPNVYLPVHVWVHMKTHTHTHIYMFIFVSLHSKTIILMGKGCP